MNIDFLKEHFYQSIDGSDIHAMLSTMTEGVPFVVELTEDDSVTGKPVTYKFVYFDTTNTKPATVYFYEGDEEVKAGDRENDKRIVLIGDSIIIIYNGVPYGLPILYFDPAALAANIPGDAGTFIQNLVRIASLWHSNGSTVFGDIVDSAKNAEGNGSDAPTLNDIQDMIQKAIAAGTLPIPAEASAKEYGDDPTPPAEEEAPAPEEAE